MSSLEERKNLTAEWFYSLRNQICTEFEIIEENYALQHSIKPGKFTSKKWNRTNYDINNPDGGGGEISKMQGNVFESVAVNISTVYGQFEPKFAQEINGADLKGNFWASGISLIAHMQNPHVPAIHMNTRFIVTQKEWFGGGIDLTPLYINPQNSIKFHQILKNACDQYNPEAYDEFKKNCDEYFYLAHRKEPRGIGGIFYDHLNSGDWTHDFEFTKNVGKAFLEFYPQIVKSHMNDNFTVEDREALFLKRGRYVEFNLLYDRGTRFGLMTGGNIEAILSSLPPIVKWQ